MKKFYITFGYGHRDRKGWALANCYTIIEAENEGIARRRIFREYGQKWAFMYKDAESAGVGKYNLKYIPYELLIEPLKNGKEARS